MERNKRFGTVSLSFNVEVRDEFGGIANIGNRADCNPGGSVICDPGTGGCGAAALSCVGSSCGGNSATKELNFDAQILVERSQLEALQKELHNLMTRFTR